MLNKILIFFGFKKPKNKRVTAILPNGKEIDTGLKSKVRTRIHCIKGEYFER